MRRALRIIKKIAIGTFAFVVFVVAVVLLLLHTDWGRNKARTITLSRLQKIFPGGIDCKAIEGSVLGDITLVDVTINAPDKHQMIHAAKVRTNLAIASLFTKTIRLEYVDIDGVEVTDPTNPVKLEEDNEEGSWSVDLGVVRVHKVNVALTQQKMTFENVDVEAGMTLEAHGELKAYANVHGNWKEHDKPFALIASAVVGDTVKLPTLSLKVGDSTIDGKKVVIDAGRSTGTIAIHATPEIVTYFAPNVTLPQATDVEIAITRPGPQSRIDLDVNMGTGSVTGAFFADLDTKQARGILAAHGIEIQRFVPRLTGSGDGVIAVTADPKGAHATVIVRGQLLDLPAGHAILGVDATPTGATALVIAGGDGGLGTAGVGALKIPDKHNVELTDAAIVTSLTDASKVTAKKVPFKGPIIVRGKAKGTIAPHLEIALSGFVDGENLRSTDIKMGGLAIGRVEGKASGKITEAGTAYRLHVTTTNVSRGGSPLGTFEVDAGSLADGRIDADVIAHPAALPTAVAKIHATVRLPVEDADPIEIQLGAHDIDAGRIRWTGDGGSIVIGEKLVEIKDIKSASGTATLAVGAKINKVTGAIDVDAKADKLPIATIDAAFKGSVSANVKMRRAGLSWNGTADVTAVGVQLGPDKPAIDGTVKIAVKDRRVTADIAASTFQIGSVRLFADIEGPRDLTDPLGWRRLERTAIKTAMVGLTRIDLGAVHVPTGGIVDGELVFAGMDANGTINIKAVQTPLGAVAGDINVAPNGDEIAASSTLHVEGWGDAQIATQIAVPLHPFEPLEWKKLGRGVLRVLTATVEDIEIEPKKLAKLGVISPFSAKANLQVVLAAGAGEARVELDVNDLVGGKLLKPVDVHVEAKIDQKETTAGVQAKLAKQEDKQLVKVDAKLPGFSFDQWLAAAATVKTAPIEARIELPDVDVVGALAMIGRPDITSGKIGGGIDIRGTVTKPTADGEIVITNVNVKPRLAGRKLPTLDELRVKLKWDGVAADLEVHGRESDKATMDIIAHANPKDIKNATAKLDIKSFDIAPIAVFLPGPAVAATGKLSADKITINGLAPEKVRGTLKLEKARMPIHPKVGTIRDANVTIKLSDLGLDYSVNAKLGSGKIDIHGDAPPDFSNLTINGSVDKISPIGEIQPVITAQLSGKLFREPTGVSGEVKISKANVTLDMEQGVKLLEDQMPKDLFIGQRPKFKEPPVPRKPWFTVKLVLDTTPVFATHEFFELRARVNAKQGVTLAIGRNLGMDGVVEIERADIDVVGRRYTIDPDHNKVTFDGTPDPLLDVSIIHQFPELLLSAGVRGRATKRQPLMIGRPAGYTENELIAFFIGADPGGDPSTTTRDAAQNAAAAYLSQKLGGKIKKKLPVKLDVVACDGGTSASGASCKAGKWITQDIFVGFKQRIEPRADESPSEFNLQYYFRRSWLFEAAGFAERVGGDFLWRKSW